MCVGHWMQSQTWNWCWIGCKCSHKCHRTMKIIRFQVLCCFQYVFFLTKSLHFHIMSRKKLGFYAIIALNWNNEVSGVLLFTQFVDSHCFFSSSNSNGTIFWTNLTRFCQKFLLSREFVWFSFIFIWLFVSKFNLICEVSLFNCTTTNYFQNSLQLKCVFL